MDRTAARTGDPALQAALFGALDDSPAEADAIILDLRPPISGRSGTHPRAHAEAGTTLQDWLTRADAPSVHVLVIVDDLTDPDRVDFLELRELAEADRITLVDADGGIVDRDRPRRLPEIAEAFQRARAPSERLNHKMIRRYGYFRTDESSRTNFSRVYFDGRYCDAELEDLYFDRVIRLVDDACSAGRDRVAVVCADATSHWLAGPAHRAVVRVREERGLDEQSLSAWSEDQVQGDTGGHLQQILLVVPVIENGATLRALRRRAEMWAPAATFEGHGVVYAGDSDAREVTSLSMPGRKPMPLEFFLVGKQSSVPRAAFSPDAAYYEAEDPGEDRFLEFTSNDFWELVIDAGFIGENDRPDFRSKLKLVPDFVTFIERNGAWVANKIERAVETLTEIPIDRVALVLVGGEVGASALAEALSSTIGNSPLRIPRKAFNAWGNDPSARTRELWRRDQPAWHESLMRVRTQVDAFVIVDEFAYTGQTLEQLAEMLQGLNLDVALILTVAAVSRRSFESALQQWKHRALYSTEWRLDDVTKWIETSGSYEDDLT